MSTSTPSELTIPVRDDPSNVAPQAISKEVRQPTNQGFNNIVDLAGDRFFNFVAKCIIRVRAKEPERKKTDEDEAYESLLDDLKYPKKGKGWNILAHTIVCFVFFVVVCTFTSLSKKWHILHKEIKSWLTLLMVLVCGYSFFRFVTFIVLEPVNRVWKLRRYMLFFTKQMRQCVIVNLWFLLVLWVWYTFFRFDVIKDTEGAHVLHTSKKEYQRVLKIIVKQITRLMMAITIGALLWTLKSAVFLYLKANLYYKELCPRIRQSILDLNAIQSIETDHKWEFIPPRRVSSVEAPKGGANNNNDAPLKGKEFWMKVSMLDKNKTPFWIIKRLAEVYMENMKDRKPQILRKIEGIDNDKMLMDEAKRLLESVKKGRANGDDDSDITPDDLRKYGLTGEGINHVFELFKSHGKETKREQDDRVEEPKTQRITRDAFLRWTLLALKNCLGLELTLRNSDIIFWKLQLVMNVCVVGITAVIWLLLSQIVDTGQTWILLSPIFTASYIYSDSMKETFGGITFVFGMHPYDVGERVKIENVEMKVKNINILTTVFVEYNSGVDVIYPNSELAKKMITNLDIAPDQPDSIEFTVPIDTPQERICDLQLKIKKTLDDDLTFTSDTTVAKKQIAEKEVTLVIHFKYLVSYLSAETKAQHRSRILSKIIKFCDEMTRKNDKAPSEEQVEILRIKIDANTKLPVIEELKKEISEICGKLKDHKILIDYSPLFLTGISKEKITMDVRMKYTKKADKNLLKQQIESAVLEKMHTIRSTKRELENEKDEDRTFWLKKSDWDDELIGI